MASGSKFDPSSNSPDRVTYPSGQRGVYTSASLSGSFREGMENRILSSLPSMSRSSSSLSQGDVMNFFHGLPVPVPGQKFSRQGQGELNRVITALGIPLDESSSGSLNPKILPASSLEELKRVKVSLHENSVKARDRAKNFNDAILKFDKCFPNISTRKRSRLDMPPSDRSNGSLSVDRSALGGSMNKGHVMPNGLDLEMQKAEGRTKNATPNKRIRTSMVEMDARANALGRAPGAVDREREVYGLANAVPSEDKDPTLTAGAESWEKSKMKKKRSGIKSDVSTGTMLTRPLDGDWESKQDTQQKLGNDPRSRLSNTHGFRSGPSNSMAGVGKSDVTSQTNGVGIRSAPRIDQDSGSLPSDRRDRSLNLDKERVNMKAISRPNIRENGSSSTPFSSTKMNAATRAPRSIPGATPKSSPNIHRAVGLDESEVSQSANRHVGSGNRKRTSSARSASPPVAQWAGQRPQKMSRIARRSNLVPPVSSNDEAPASDAGSSVAAHDNGLEFPRRLSSGTPHQVKLKGDNFPSAALSESEESGAAETKSKEKGRKSGETDEKSGPNVQKVANIVLPSRKNKVIDEDIGVGDGVRRQGRTVRAFTSMRSGIPLPNEKLDNAVTSKQLRSARLGLDKIESKAGRPPTRKPSDRKAYARPRNAINCGLPYFHGESDDGQEELIGAAKAAVNLVDACSGSSFWRQMEPHFGFISAEDITYLKQQGDPGPGFPAPNNSRVCAENNSITNGIGLGSFECKRDLVFAKELNATNCSPEQLGTRIGIHNVTPYCQRLLGALVLEEEDLEIYCSDDGNSQFDIYETKSELDEELKFESWSHRSIGNVETVGRPVSNGYRITASRRYHDELEQDGLECSDITADTNGGLTKSCGNSHDGLHLEKVEMPNSACTESQYDQMTMDERVLLELQSIGIFPEPLSNLAQGEENDIGEEILRLEEALHEQVSKKKILLSKLEKCARVERESQERVIERRAFDKLVGKAYEKYMACWGPNASCGKGANGKIAKHAALNFVKWVLGRCQKFEDLGESCFNEPAFVDIFHSIPPLFNNGNCMPVTTEGESSKQHAETPVVSSETRVTASLGSHPSPSLIPHLGQYDTDEKYSPGGFQSLNPPGQSTGPGREDAGLNRVKKRELLLDDVVGGTIGTSLRGPSGIGGTLLSGAKGKRSERDGKGHNREVVSRSGNAKLGRPSLGNAKGERKSKTKPKQKTTQLSASVNNLLGKSSEIPDTVITSVSKSCEVTTGSKKKKDESHMDNLNDSEAPLDLSHLQLPEMDVLGVPDDLDGQGQDLASWLNIDDDGLQDHDFMGLEIPMDDLSDLNMMV
ncbi:hypothetical protein Sjap_019768 [Stephania japonica]|uniref:Uncharacterized protein n=1 Tax=Stephania japonica TaxID=461633 RepID=A0AAP0F034_9MAGN